jgi:hypothetical protein
MGVSYVTVDGREISGEQMAKILDQKRAKAPSKRADAPQTYHKGWRVVGHPPGALHAAKLAAERDWAEYLKMDPPTIMERYPGGKGIPKPWDEASWRRNAPLKAVRSKPYEIHAAAVECAVMARNAGWTDVRIDTLSKGEPEQDSLL